jgi:hypothetical protein
MNKSLPWDRYQVWSYVDIFVDGVKRLISVCYSPSDSPVESEHRTREPRLWVLYLTSRSDAEGGWPRDLPLRFTSPMIPDSYLLTSWNQRILSMDFLTQVSRVRSSDLCRRIVLLRDADSSMAVRVTMSWRPRLPLSPRNSKNQTFDAFISNWKGLEVFDSEELTIEPSPPLLASSNW